MGNVSTLWPIFFSSMVLAFFADNQSVYESGCVVMQDIPDYAVVLLEEIQIKIKKKELEYEP